MSLKVPKVVSDLKSLSVAVFRATQLLPKHMRPKVGGSRGYQLMQVQLSSELAAMSLELARGDWPWQAYNSFVVCDPKRRTIYAAPFRDRVVHHAIHQIIAPEIEPLIPPRFLAGC